MNFCYRQIIEVKMLRPTFWSSFFNKRWKLSIKYYNPHYERKFNHYKYIYIPIEEDVLVEHSVETIECLSEDSAKRMKRELEHTCQKCGKFYCLSAGNIVHH